MASSRESCHSLIRLVRRALHASGTLLHAVTEGLVPARCIACEGLLSEVAEGFPSAVWCDACAASVVPLGFRFCLTCRSLQPGRGCCRDPLTLQAAVQYGDAVGSLVRHTKYEGWEPLLDAWFAVWCAVFEEGGGSGGEPPDLFCAVPTHPVRQRERGMALPDAWTQRLAARAGRPRIVALRRDRDTRPQVGLDRGRRRANLAGAFLPGPEAAAVRGRRVALVDDVVTSGATVREGANLLGSLGAREVEVWSFAYEPLE